MCVYKYIQYLFICIYVSVYNWYIQYKHCFLICFVACHHMSVVDITDSCLNHNVSCQTCVLLMECIDCNADRSRYE